MDKILCFKLNNDELYLNQILVDYTNIPIFFICKGKKDYYLVLLTDYNNYNYIIVTITKDDIYNLLTQKNHYESCNIKTKSVLGSNNRR